MLKNAFVMFNTQGFVFSYFYTVSAGILKLAGGVGL